MLLILLLLPLICAAVILPLKNRPRAIYTVSVLGAFATSITGLSAAGRVFSSGTLSGLNNSLYLDAL